MTTTPPTGPGVLLFGADWAIAHGDADGLAHVTAELAQRLAGSIGVELNELSRLCQIDYDTATERWPKLRGRVRSTLAVDRGPSWTV